MTLNPADRMNAEQSLAVADAMISLWESEFPATLRVVRAVKDDARDYTPHPKSRTAWQLATHIAIADVWFADSIVKGQFQFDPEAAKQAEASFPNVAAVAHFYEQTLPAKLAALRALSADQLSEIMDFFGIMQMSRAQWIGFSNNHSVHHRGQLSAYLRACGSKVPNIYGPSADAEAATA